MVERGIWKREPLGAAPNQGHVSVARGSRREHGRALVEANDRASVAAGKLASDEAGPGRNVQHPILGRGVNGADESRPPPGILSEREERPDALVGLANPREDPGSVSGGHLPPFTSGWPAADRRLARSATLSGRERRRRCRPAAPAPCSARVRSHHVSWRPRWCGSRSAAARRPLWRRTARRDADAR